MQIIIIIFLVGFLILLWLLMTFILSPILIKNTHHYQVCISFIRSNKTLSERLGQISEIKFSPGPGGIYGNTRCLRFHIQGSHKSARVRLILQASTPLREDWNVVLAKIIQNTGDEVIFGEV